MTDYSELKRLAEDATPGPWGYDGSYVCPARVEGGTTYVESWRSVADCSLAENTKFIAAANPAAVLALIAENEMIKAQFDECARLFVDATEQACKAQRERDQLRSALAKAKYRIEQGRVWAGTKWQLTGLHPLGQQKALDVIDAAMRQGEQA